MKTQTWRFCGGAWFSTYSYASTQVDIEEPLRTGILAWAKDNIDPADLVPDGLETDPHITVKYGLVTPTAPAVAAVLQMFPPGKAMIGRLDLFEHEGKPDVLYISIESDDLEELNEALCTLPHVDTCGEYEPHLTLAYLNAGMGAKYLDIHTPFNGEVISYDKVALSGTDGTKQLLPLGNEQTPETEVLFAGVVDGVTRFSCCGVIQVSGDDNTREGFIDGVPYIEKRARLFKAGTYQLGDKSAVYGTAELDKMAASIAARQPEDASWDVPVQLDHEWSARDTVGNVREADRVNDELWGWLRFVGCKAVECVKGKLWLKLSIAHDLAYALNEVSVTPFPRVPTAQLFSKPNINIKEDEPVAEASKDAAQPQTQSPVQSTPTPATTNFDASAFEAKMRAEFAESNRKQAEEMAALRQQNADMAVQSASVMKTLRFAQLKQTVEQFKADGTTTPAMAEAELKMLESMDDAQIEQYKAVKAKQPKIVDLAVYGVQTADAPAAASNADYEAGKAASLARQA